MRLEQLYYFITTSEYRSINAAADKLFITQQSLNNAITAMEKELNCKLFHRSQKGISLTEQGELVKKTSIEMLSMWNQLQDTLAIPTIVNSSTKQNLSLCVSPRIADYMLPKFVNAFQTQYPNVSVYCADENYLDILNGNITLDSYDIIFNTLYYKKHGYIEHYNTDIYSDFVPLFEQKTYLICNKESELANVTSISSSQLQHLPIRTYASQEIAEVSNESLTYLYKKLGLNETILVSNSLSYCLQGLLDNLFYFFCAQGPILQMLDRPELVTVPVDLPFKIYTGYHTIHDKPFSPTALQFIRLISDTVTNGRLNL